MEEKIFNEIKKLPGFERDFKKLYKRYSTLEEDIETFIKSQLKLFHKLHINNNGVARVSNLNIDYPFIYKTKKFACKSLKGRGSDSGIRIIYAYYDREDIIEFIEIYFKADKENEDKERIKNYYI